MTEPIISINDLSISIQMKSQPLSDLQDQENQPCSVLSTEWEI